MRTATVALKTLLITSGKRRFWRCECVEFELKSGQFLRYTNADVNVRLPETPTKIFYSEGAAQVNLGEIHSKLGLETDKVDCVVLPRAIGETDAGQITALPVHITEAARNGAFDMATVRIYRCFADMPGPVLETDLVPEDDTADPESFRYVFDPVGSVLLFEGVVNDLQPTLWAINFELASGTELFNLQMPRYVYSRYCAWDLYGVGCGINKGDYLAYGRTGPGSTRFVIKGAAQVYAPPTAPKYDQQTNNYYALGFYHCRTGNNAGLMRGIRESSGGTLTLMTPLPYDPGEGGAFLVYAGCDKTVAACKGKFDNIKRYRGFPGMPGPDLLHGSKSKDDILW